MKKQPDRFNLIKILGLGALSCLMLWLAWRPPLLLQAQEPTITPVIGDIYFDGSRCPCPATPTPTPIPDYEPPASTLVVEPAANSRNWYRTPVTVTFQAVDDFTGWGRTWHKLAGEANEAEWNIYEDYYPPVTVTLEGTHTLHYFSEDKVGNLEAVQTAPLNIDLTPPTVTHTLAGVQLPTGWYTASVTITLSGQDNLSGLDAYEINLNRRGWLRLTAAYTVTAPGFHRLAYRAIDQAGNLSAVKSASFVIEGNRSIYLPIIRK